MSQQSGNNKIEIELKKIVDLSPAVYNPREISDEALDGLESSIDRFGLVEPIVWNRRTGNVVGGHQRLKVLERKGIEETEVSVVDLSEDEEKALNVALNNPAIAGAFTRDLQFILDDLKVKLDDGFKKIRLDEIHIPGLRARGTGERIAIEEQPVNIPDESRVRSGEIWKLGDHLLLCGDARDRSSIVRMLGDERELLVITDPPYGISAVGGNGKIGGDRILGKNGFDSLVKANVYPEIKGDEDAEVARKVYDLLRDLEISDIVYFGGTYFTDFLPVSRGWIIWNKGAVGNFAPLEIAWTSIDRHPKIYEFKWAGLVREGDRKSELVKRVHPTQKPVGLFEMIIEDLSPGKIFDPFAGSGSVLIASEKRGIPSFHIEYEESYCEVIISRWEEFTGSFAIKLEEKSDVG